MLKACPPGCTGALGEGSRQRGAYCAAGEQLERSARHVAHHRAGICLPERGTCHQLQPRGAGRAGGPCLVALGRSLSPNP